MPDPGMGGSAGRGVTIAGALGGAAGAAAPAVLVITLLGGVVCAPTIGIASSEQPIR